MDIGFTPKQEEFRSSVRTWLEKNVPDDARPERGPEMAEFDVAWQRALHSAGWAGVAWPKEHGGGGFSPIEQLLWWEESVHAGAPMLGVNFVGIGHAGPTLIVHGTDQQKTDHLSRILSGDSLWCQGFSEPNAGSDLGALRARGVVDGDHVVVSGRKVWTGYAQFAHQQELLVRTSSGDKKHQGITWLICDMALPGIDIRPIATIDGSEHFCEVTYDDVKIPVENVVGEIDRGWSVAMTNLGHERATGQIGAQLELERSLKRVRLLAEDLHDSETSSPGASAHFRVELAQLAADVRGLRSLTFATVSKAVTGGDPQSDGAVVRLYFTELVQRIQSLAIDLLGDRAIFLDPAAPSDADWVRTYMLSYKETIAGGTNDIQRNTIANRVLGLPRSWS